MNTTNPESPPSLLSPFRGFSHGWSRYAEFRGRSSRVEFWSFHIVNLFIEWVLVWMSLMTQGVFDSLLMLTPIVVHQLVKFIPSISIWVRRLHDVGSSGWWVFWALFPWALGIIIIFATIADAVFGQFGFSEKIEALSLAIVPIVALAFVLFVGVANSLPITICFWVIGLVLILIGAIFGETIPDNIDSLLGEADLLGLIILALAMASATLMVNFTSVAMCFVDGDPGPNEYGPNPKLNPDNPSSSI